VNARDSGRLFYLVHVLGTAIVNKYFSLFFSSTLFLTLYLPIPQHIPNLDFTGGDAAPPRTSRLDNLTARRLRNNPANSKKGEVLFGMQPR